MLQTTIDSISLSDLKRPLAFLLLTRLKGGTLCQQNRRISRPCPAHGQRLDPILGKLEDYLTTASRLYKYPFADQLMIYAQRPDATACADFDI